MLRARKDPLGNESHTSNFLKISMLKLRTSIQNSVSAKGKTQQQQSSKHENRDASPTIDLLQRSFESLQHALNNKELELMSPSHGGQDHRYLV